MGVGHHGRTDGARVSEVLGMIQFHVPGVPIPQGSKKSIPHKDTAQQRATKMSGVGRRIEVSPQSDGPRLVTEGLTPSGTSGKELPTW